DLCLLLCHRLNHLLVLYFFFMIPPPPTSTLFPYTTLFRSLRMFLLLITFLKASHSFRNRLLVICKNAYLFATMIMTSVSRMNGKDRKSGSAGMPRPSSYAVFCLKKNRQ